MLHGVPPRWRAPKDRATSKYGVVLLEIGQAVSLVDRRAARLHLFGETELLVSALYEAAFASGGQHQPLHGTLKAANRNSPVRSTRGVFGLLLLSGYDCFIVVAVSASSPVLRRHEASHRCSRVVDSRLRRNYGRSPRRWSRVG